MRIRTETKNGNNDFRVDHLIDSYLHQPSENYSADKEFFFTVQIGRYFSGKGKDWFNSFCEKDVIMEIVEDSWRELIKVQSLKRLGKEEKVNLFSNYLIFFPQFCLHDENRCIVYANFG